jgi:cyclase
VKKIIVSVLGMAAIALIAFGIIYGPVMRSFMGVKVVEVDPQLKIFLGGGGNSLVLKSEDNQQVLIVDTKMGAGAKQLKKYVDSINPNPQITIINTHMHADHTGGNKLFANAKIIASDYSDEEWQKETKSRLPDEKIKARSEKTFQVGTETVKVYNAGQAHTTNDTVVYLANRKMLHTGDLGWNRWHPAMYAASKANIGKWIQVLDYLLKTYDIQTVLPGHGEMMVKNELKDLQDYFISIYAAVGDKQKLDALRTKYQDYLSLPGMTSFDKTVRYIENEKKAENQK